MKSIEQLRAEAASYAITVAGELKHRLSYTSGSVAQRMAIESAVEKAFLAGWQASRGGVK